jgi:hypothetical protein
MQKYLYPITMLDIKDDFEVLFNSSLNESNNDRVLNLFKKAKLYTARVFKNPVLPNLRMNVIYKIADKYIIVVAIPKNNLFVFQKLNLNFLEKSYVTKNQNNIKCPFCRNHIDYYDWCDRSYCTSCQSELDTVEDFDNCVKFVTNIVNYNEIIEVK